MSTSKKPSELSEQQLKRFIRKTKASLKEDEGPGLKKQLKALLKEKQRRLEESSNHLEALSPLPLPETEETYNELPASNSNPSEEGIDTDSGESSQEDLALDSDEPTPPTLENPSSQEEGSSSNPSDDQSFKEKSPEASPEDNNNIPSDEVNIEPSHKTATDAEDNLMQGSPSEEAPQSTTPIEANTDPEQDPCYLSITFQPKGMPVLSPIPLGTKSDNPFEKFRLATRRRKFNLHEDWRFELNCPQDERFTGRYLIPSNLEDYGLTTKGSYDGASVPFPWLVSFLTMGAMRPFGVMLMPSMVHDFLYFHGVLLKENNQGQYEKVEISRPEADTLFFHIIKDLNDLEGIAWMAYYSVRFGYNWVDYGGRNKGSLPIKISLIGLVSLCFSTVVLFLYWAWITVPLFLGHLFTYFLHLVVKTKGERVKPDSTAASETTSPNHDSNETVKKLESQDSSDQSSRASEGS